MTALPALTTGFIPLTQGHNFLLSRPANRADTAATPHSNVSTDALIVLPPFAEEMNKSRHIISQLMSVLAQKQFNCFMLDNFGTGDSEGDLTDATTNLWRDDLASLIEHLAQAGYSTISFVAIRFGALQLFDLLNQVQPALPVKQVVLWQPVFDSKKLWQQFVRVKIAEAMASGSKVSQAEIEQQIASGDTVEIAGYPVNGAFYHSLFELQPTFPPALSQSKLHWLEVSKLDTVALPVQKTKAMIEQHTELHFEQLKAESFWQTQELASADELIAATAKLLGAQHAP